MIDCIVRQPFTRRHPALSGMLVGVGFIVVLIIIEPPLFWPAGWLFKPIFHVLAWWFGIWQ